MVNFFFFHIFYWNWFFTKFYAEQIKKQKQKDTTTAMTVREISRAYKWWEMENPCYDRNYKPNQAEVSFRIQRSSPENWVKWTQSPLL